MSWAMRIWARGTAVGLCASSQRARVDAMT
jgi:hypothetical protein